MQIVILLLIAVIVGLVLGLFLRKIVLNKINQSAYDFLDRKGSTLEKELQSFISAQNYSFKVSSARPYYAFKYKNKKYTCIITKFKIEGKKEWFTGIVSDSGSCTDFEKFQLVSYYREGFKLLNNIYEMPKCHVNREFISNCPKLPNVHKMHIRDDEYVILNSVVKNFKTDGDISIGLNAKLTMTDKNIYIYNGMGLWVIDLYNSISDCKRCDMYMEIELTEICFFGQNGERMCTGYKLFFDNEELAKFEEMMNNIIK